MYFYNLAILTDYEYCISNHKYNCTKYKHIKCIRANSLTVLISSFNSTLNYQNKHSVSHIRGGQYDQNIILQIKQFYNNNIIIFWCKQGCYDTAKSYASSLTNKTSKVSNKMNIKIIIKIM